MQVQIFGHDWAVNFLRETARTDAQGTYPQLRHAYLFTGETGLGKSTLARWLAQSLFCTGAEGDPCGTCRDCQAMRGGNHPDFLQIVPTDSQGQTNRLNGLLRVEQAEDIQHHAMLRPFQSKHRVILIRDLQLAHESFLNKLLKTFEEPPPAVVLLGTVGQPNIDEDLWRENPDVHPTRSIAFKDDSQVVKINAEKLAIPEDHSWYEIELERE